MPASGHANSGPEPPRGRPGATNCSSVGHTASSIEPMIDGPSLLDLVRAATATVPTDPSARPDSVRIEEAGRLLTLARGGRADVTVSAPRLRLSCRCAWCTRARIDGAFPIAADEVRIRDAEPVGGYAIRLFFTDGHDRGIFPWVFIDALAPDGAAETRPALPRTP